MPVLPGNFVRASFERGIPQDFVFVSAGRGADAEGQEQDLGAFGPQQVMKLALGLQNGSEYWQRMVNIAQGNVAGAAQQQQRGVTSGGKPMQPRDLDTAYAQMMRRGGDVGSSHPRGPRMMSTVPRQRSWMSRSITGVAMAAIAFLWEAAAN